MGTAALTYSQLPAGTDELFIWSEAGVAQGVGTVADFNQIVADGLVPSLVAITFTRVSE